MGAWGVGITSNDAAQDLKKDFQAKISIVGLVYGKYVS